MAVFSLILACALSFYIGMRLRYLQDQLTTLKGRLDEKKPEPSVAMGVYDKVDTANHTDTPSQYGIAEVKTPQLLAWEEEERIKKGIENV